MEFSPCVSANGDPTGGQATPTFANCPGTTKLSAVSAAYRAEDLFGRLALTIPLYSPAFQYGYLSKWTRAINSDTNGLPQYFTWLNAWTSAKTTFSQGFSSPTKSLNPYSASTYSDFQVLNVLYDTLMVPNPLDFNQPMDWMTSGHSLQCNVSGGVQCDQGHLGYAAAAGTVATYRFTLRGDIFWQSDSVGMAHPARPLTSWDVRFSYLTLKSTGSFQGGVLSPVTDVHVIDKQTFDINLAAIGPFIIFNITAPTIIPGRYWSSVCSGATWDTDVTSGNVPDSCMAVTIQMATIPFDPLSTAPNNGVSTGILIGSSAFECQSTGGIVGGGGCSSSGAQNPPLGAYTLTRFGCNLATNSCNAPGSNPTTNYFRSDGTLALDIWTGNNGDSTHDLVNLGVIANCFGKPAGTTGCVQWQRGIGNPGTGTPVNIAQVSTAVRLLQDGSWTPSYNWISGTPLACCPFTSAPPLGIEVFPLVIYEGTATLNPCSVDPVNGYDC
jgi:hypothetical protein